MLRALVVSAHYLIVPSILSIALGGCSGASDNSEPATYSISGNITGLTGSVTLLRGGGNALTMSTNGTFTFTTPLASGNVYVVSVGTQPAGQTCLVTNGSGTINGTAVTNVAISCVANHVAAYSVGNSLTWDSQPDGVSALAASQNITFAVGYHIQPGQPLSYTTANPSPSDPNILSLQITNTFGTFDNALGNNAWSIVTIQPYLSSTNAASTLGTDVAAIELLINLTNAGPSSNVRYYIYEGWPNTPSWQYPPLSTDAYSTTWDAPSINNFSTPTTLSREYFDNLYAAIRAAYPQDQFFIIPVGAVLSALDKEITAGHINGLHSIYDLYRDAAHLNYDVGRFVVAATVYATYFRTSPVGLTVPTGFYTRNGQPNGLPSVLVTNTLLRNQLEQVVWNVVSSDPRTGVIQFP